MADTTIDASVHTLLNMRSLRLGPVWTDEGTAYVVYVDADSTLVYSKTVNGGVDWAAATEISDGEIGKASIWYDRWTPGDTGTTIHIVYNELALDDVFYRDLDTFDDSLGTEITIWASDALSSGTWGASVVDITKARGGNLYCGFWGASVGGKFGFYRSDDNGATWDARADVADGNAVDGILLMPGDEADNQDIWCIYWDRSADEITLKTYDNSGDSWGTTAETSISLNMVDDASYFQMSAAPRHSDNHVILAAWSELDTATADLKVWDIGGAASIVAKTNVLTNSNNSGQAAVLINQQNDDIYVAYIKGASFPSTVDIHYQKSTDGGANWDGEEDYSEGTNDDFRAVWAGISVGNDGGKFQPSWFNDDFNDLLVNLVNDVDIAAVAVGGQPTMLRTQGIPTGSGAHDRPGRWN